MKNALVLRVSGMTVEASADVLTMRYLDEAAVSVSERFDFGKPKQRAVWNRIFGRRLAQGRHPLALEQVEQVLRVRGLLPVPDFVVARKVQGFYRVQERIFDYVGGFRRANEEH